MKDIDEPKNLNFFENFQKIWSKIEFQFSDKYQINRENMGYYMN
jgi:hypothetical protein